MINTTDLPAFPRDHANDGHNDMTLRDYFAAKAMQALIPIHRAEPDFDMMKSAYRYADEMLKARES